MKRIFSVMLALLLLLPQGEYVLAAQSREAPASQAGEENPWEGFDAFSSAVSELLGETMEDNYISSVTLEVNSTEMTVNGEEQPVIEGRDAAPMVKSDTIMLPVRALAACEDAEVSYDFKTKTATVQTEDGEISFTQGEAAAVSDRETEEETLTPLSAEPELVDGTMYVPLETMADFLGYEAEMAEEKIVLTKPYQTKRLIVKSSETNLEDYGAVESVSGFNGLHILQYETEQDAKEALVSFKLSDEVEYVEPDLVVSTVEAHKSWGTDSIEADTYNQYLQEHTDLDEVVVAVVDSGVDSKHEFLKDRLIPVDKNFVNSKPNADDDDGHGTHVSGIIRDATLSNVKILPVKAMNEKGEGTLASIYNGMMYAISQDCDVINASLGAFGKSSLMEEVVLSATAHNIPMVIAAGNDCMDALTGVLSSIDEAIVVGALDKTLHYAEYSNYGQTVDIWAPGSDILSSVPGNAFAEESGTSMASPLVAAVAAMLKTYDKSLSPRQIEIILSDYALDLSIGEPNNSGTSKVVSAGRLSQFTAAEKQEVVATPVLSVEPGYYCQDNLTIEMTCETPDAAIRYTTDGTVPTETTGFLYTEPVTFHESVQLTVRAFKEGWIDSYKDSGAYFISMYPESMHNYAYSYYDVWDYICPDKNVKYLKITFDDKTYIPYPDPELKYARRLAKYEGQGMYLSNGNQRIENEYTEPLAPTREYLFAEDDLSGKEVIVPGPWFRILFFANLSSQDYGFKITKVEPLYEERLPEPRAVVPQNELYHRTATNCQYFDDFDSPRPLALESEEGAEIYYTLDGSTPDKNSIRYTEPIILDQPAKVRAKAYKDGWIESPVSLEYYMATSKYPESLHYKRRVSVLEENVWAWRAPADVVYMAVTFDEETSLCPAGMDPANGMYIDFTTQEDETVGTFFLKDEFYLEPKFYGTELAGKTVLIPGNFFELRTTAPPLPEGASAPYGFKIANIRYYYDEEDVLRDGCIDISQPDSESGDLSEETATLFISTAEELIALAEQSESDDAYKGVTICLTDDIDLGGKEWPKNGFNHFAGVFDGQNHKISHLACVKDRLFSTSRKMRFISEAGKSAVLKNVWFDSFGDIVHDKIMETCIIKTNYGTVYNVTVDGLLYSATPGVSDIGGITTQNMYTGKIYNCHVTGTVYLASISSNNAGGIAGYNDGVIDSCTMRGNVIGNDSIGGICGQNSSRGIIINCSSAGSLYFDTSDFLYPGSIGGITGYQKGSHFPCRLGPRIKNCYTVMTIRTEESIAIGSLIGNIYNYPENLYARSNVALSNIVMGEGESGRVAASVNNHTEELTFWNCFAWDGMQIGSPDVLRTVENHGLFASGTFDGMDVSKEEVRTKAFWEDAGFDFDDGTWHWEEGKMPYTSSENVWNWPEWLILDETESEDLVPPSILQEPAAKNLFYNEKPQVLLSEGTIFGGVIEYSLEKDGDYTTQIPELTNIGTYTVWYRVVGDEEHADISPIPVEVEIKKRQPALPLNLTAVPGNTLRSVALPEGWSWVDPDMVLVCGLNDVHCFYPETETECEYNAYMYVNAPHVIEKIEERPASCSEEGNLEYWACAVCGKAFADEDGKTAASLDDYKTEKLPHTPGTEADCTHDQTCTVCDEVLTEKLGHDWGNWRVTKAPSTEETGEELRECSRCGELETREIPRHVHTLVKAEAKAATCTEEGLQEHWMCTDCDCVFSDAQGEQMTTLDDLKIEKPPHTPGTAADCTHDQTCTVCGTVLAEKLGHDYKNTVTPPTCTEKGYTTHTCTRCKGSYTDSEIAAKGHTPGAAADCTHDQTCTVCGAVLVRRLGHAYRDTVVPPTCTRGGYTLHTCAKCGYNFIDAKTAAKGHTPGTAADCTHDQTCTVCGAVLVKKLGHDYKNTVTPPTCTKKGYTTHTCTRCKDSYVDNETEMLEHSWGSWSEFIPSTCTQEGKETRACKQCKKQEMRDLPLKEHVPGAAATCTAPQTCIMCGKVLEEAKPHTPGEWELWTSPTTTSEGERVRHCTVCSTIVERKTIPKLEPTPTPSPTPTPPPIPTPTPTPTAAPTPTHTPTPPNPDPGLNPDPGPSPLPELPFTDVKEGAWYYEAVSWAYGSGLMSGTTETIFSPNGATTRGMIVTILWRLEKEPQSTDSMPFTDVRPGIYYYEPVRWAAGQGIVKGKSATSFAPNDPITRQELAAILYRYAGSPDATGSLGGFTDSGKVADYARPAMEWAVTEGIVAGTGSGILDPRGKSTRAQTAAMLMRYVE